jgi:hypothetical protein
MACPGCQAEFPASRPLSAYDYLSQQNAAFLETFLACRGNLKEVQEVWNISYPTAKKRLDQLLSALGLAREQETEEESMMQDYQPTNLDSTKASDIVRNKLYESGGQATVTSITGLSYVIRAGMDGEHFLCDALPMTPPFTYAVFDVIVELLKANGGKADKGNGRNYRLGEGKCTTDTVVGAIGKNYFGKPDGCAVFDPVFVLAAILDWAGVAHNGRGYLQLTNAYCQRLARQEV